MQKTFIKIRDHIIILAGILSTFAWFGIHSRKQIEKSR